MNSTIQQRGSTMTNRKPNLHTMDSRSACIQNVLKVKVKVKVHVIRALLCWHENRLFSLSNCSIATKLAVDGLQESVAQILGSPISRERLFVGSRR